MPRCRSLGARQGSPPGHSLRPGHPSCGVCHRRLSLSATCKRQDTSHHALGIRHQIAMPGKPSQAMRVWGHPACPLPLPARFLSIPHAMPCHQRAPTSQPLLRTARLICMRRFRDLSLEFWQAMWAASVPSRSICCARMAVEAAEPAGTGKRTSASLDVNFLHDIPNCNPEAAHSLDPLLIFVCCPGAGYPIQHLQSTDARAHQGLPVTASSFRPRHN